MKRNSAKNFHELRKKMSLEAQEKARVLAQKYTEEMPLDQLLRESKVRPKAGIYARRGKR